MKPSIREKIIVGVSLFIVLISFLGILDASYISYGEITGIVPPCKPPFACDTVLTSRWSRVGPIPLAFFGVFYYSLVFSLSTALFLGKKVVTLPKSVRFSLLDLLTVLTTMGLLFSGYLIFIMAVLIQAWCLYCVFSASFCVSLFVLTTIVRMQVKGRQVISFKRNLFRALYQWIAKPFFFLLDAELVHETMVATGKMFGMFALTRFLTAKLFAYNHPKLIRKIDGITFVNPVGLAAGFDYNANLPDILPAVGFGFATMGTITNRPYAGNTSPRLGRYPRSKALLVNKGFKSIGAKDIIKKLEHKHFAIPIGISIGSTNMMHASLSDQIADVMQTFNLFEHSHVHHAYYEMNISCPNTKGGQPFTTVANLTKLLVQLDNQELKKPVYIKMPIDLGREQTLALLEVADKHNIQGVIFGNLTKDKENPDIDPIDREQWKKVAGNLSGKPTFNRSNYCISLTKQVFKDRFTIIGTGGIFTPEDAKLKMLLGADLVQLISGMIFEGPQLVGTINESLVTKSS